MRRQWVWVLAFFALIASLSFSQSSNFSVNPSATPGVAKTSESIQFKANPSGFLQSENLSYFWDFNDGSSSTERNPTHEFAASGVYRAMVTATGSLSGSVSGLVIVGVYRLAASGSASPSPAVVDSNVSFNSGNSVIENVSSPQHSWSFGDDSSSSLQNPQHTYSTAGLKVVRLVIKGTVADENVSSTHDFNLSVSAAQAPPPPPPAPAPTPSPQNNPPTADFSFTPLEPRRDENVSFTDSSTDFDGSVVAWEWDFGDSTPKSFQRHPVHKYSVEGTFTVKLKVWDDGNSTATAQKAVTVSAQQPAPANQPPTASVKASSLEIVAGGKVDFSGEGSSDSDGLIASHSWHFEDDGSVADGAKVTHLFGKTGTFKVSLTVKDNSNATSTESVSIKVNPATAPSGTPEAARENEPPKAEIAVLQGKLEFFVGDRIELAFDKSFDPDGSIAKSVIEYTDEDGFRKVIGVGIQNSHTLVFNKPVFTEVILSVTDDKGAEGRAFLKLQVKALPSKAPLSWPSVPAQARVGEPVSFTGSGSYDPEGSALFFSWDFGDGFTTNLPDPTHSFPFPGRYLVTLTVTDGERLSSSSSREVTVLAQGEALSSRPSFSLTRDPVSKNLGISFTSTDQFTLPRAGSLSTCTISQSAVRQALSDAAPAVLPELLPAVEKLTVSGAVTTNVTPLPEPEKLVEVPAPSVGVTPVTGKEAVPVTEPLTDAASKLLTTAKQSPLPVSRPTLESLKKDLDALTPEARSELVTGLVPALERALSISCESQELAPSSCECVEGKCDCVNIPVRNLKSDGIALEFETPDTVSKYLAIESSFTELRESVLPREGAAAPSIEALAGTALVEKEVLFEKNARRQSIFLKVSNSSKEDKKVELREVVPKSLLRNGKVIAGECALSECLPRNLHLGEELLDSFILLRNDPVYSISFAAKSGKVEAIDYKVSEVDGAESSAPIVSLAGCDYAIELIAPVPQFTPYYGINAVAGELKFALLKGESRVFSPRASATLSRPDGSTEVLSLRYDPDQSVYSSTYSLDDSTGLGNQLYKASVSMTHSVCGEVTEGVEFEKQGSPPVVVTDGVGAAGLESLAWIPVLGLIILTILVSWLYVRKYRKEFYSQKIELRPPRLQKPGD